jgi:hypothetical protein
VIWQEFTCVSEHCCLPLRCNKGGYNTQKLQKVYSSKYGITSQKKGKYVEIDVKTSHLAKFKYINRIDISARKIKKQERYQEKKEYTDDIGRRGECLHFQSPKRIYFNHFGCHAVIRPGSNNARLQCRSDYIARCLC